MNKNILIVISLLCMDKLISSTYPIIGGVNHKATCLQLLERELQKPNIVPASRRVIEKQRELVRALPDSASLSEVNDTYKVALEDVNEVLGTAAKISPYTQKAEQAAKLSERRRAAMHKLTQRREQAELQALQASTKPQSSGNQAVVDHAESVDELAQWIETECKVIHKKKSSGKK